ncbi:hypothetical protein FKP32DRAFT_1730486 [Trametes sanguinea]|nr:hypothetical protein FKP32DRAFT_1730486 [Trametes sanguinea]
MPQSLYDPHFLADTIAEAKENIGPLLDDPAESSLAVPAVPSEGTYNVPIALTENNTAVYGHMEKVASVRNPRFAKEGQKFALGPMPLREFLETFCPCPAEVLARMPPAQEAFAKVPEAAQDEQDIYVPLIAALNHAHNGVHRCPGHTFVNTSTHLDVKGDYIVKPDVTCYANKHVPKVRVNDLHSHTDMGYATFPIEVKCGVDADLFSDPYEHLGSSRGHLLVNTRLNKKDSGKALAAFGQVMSYVAEISACQFRCFCFLVCLYGCHARLMRWDRAGLIVTRRFHLQRDPEILCEFVWRYAHMSEVQRGMDSTVYAATPSEEAQFLSAIRTHVALQLGLASSEETSLNKSVLEHYQPRAVSAVSVGDGDTSLIRLYLVSRPIVSPISATGRSTRSYWAVDKETGRLVYLKDTWRYRTAGAEMEGAVIAKLNEYGVRGVPGVIQHGHVPNIGNIVSPDIFQHTLTQAFKGAKWACDQGIDSQAMVMYSHYRMVTSIAGYSVHRFTGTRELLTAGHQTLQTLIDAQLRNRLHRNVHPAAIVLHRDNKGQARRAVLHDWDLSWCHTAPNPHAALPHDAMWQFMSISVLLGEPVPYTIQDDMESLLYNMLYCSLRWLDHNLPEVQLEDTMTKLFDYSSWFQGEALGSDQKLTNAQRRKYTARVKFTNPSLRHWLNKLMDFHHPRVPAQVTAASGEPPTFPLTTEEWLVPTKLEEAWRQFLNRTELATGDRVVRNLNNEARTVEEGAEPHPATLPSLVHGRKRAADDFADDQPVGRDRASGRAVPQDTPPQKKPKVGRVAQEVEGLDAIDLSEKTWEPLAKLGVSSESSVPAVSLERHNSQLEPSNRLVRGGRRRQVEPRTKATTRRNGQSSRPT